MAMHGPALAHIWASASDREAFPVGQGGACGWLLSPSGRLGDLEIGRYRPLFAHAQHLKKPLAFTEWFVVLYAPFKRKESVPPMGW